MSNYLNDIFDKREKPISDNSRNLYKRNLEKLNDNQDVVGRCVLYLSHNPM